jgi:hypothetical protein
MHGRERIEEAFREGGRGEERRKKEKQCMAEREIEKASRDGGGKKRGEKE